MGPGGAWLLAPGLAPGASLVAPSRLARTARVEDTAETLGAGYLPLWVAQAPEGFAVPYVFPALPCFIPGTVDASSRNPPDFAGGSGQAAGAAADHSSAELILEYLTGWKLRPT